MPPTLPASTVQARNRPVLPITCPPSLYTASCIASSALVRADKSNVAAVARRTASWLLCCLSGMAQRCARSSSVWLFVYTCRNMPRRLDWCWTATGTFHAECTQPLVFRSCTTQHNTQVTAEKSCAVWAIKIVFFPRNEMLSYEKMLQHYRRC
jgi:hypothetical protein